MTVRHEAPAMYHGCSACGRTMRLRELVAESRHVGGKPDRIELYCRAGVGHRTDEAREVTTVEDEIFWDLRRQDY